MPYTRLSRFVRLGPPEFLGPSPRRSNPTHPDPLAMVVPHWQFRSRPQSRRLFVSRMLKLGVAQCLPAPTTCHALGVGLWTGWWEGWCFFGRGGGNNQSCVSWRICFRLFPKICSRGCSYVDYSRLILDILEVVHFQSTGSRKGWFGLMWVNNKQKWQGFLLFHATWISTGFLFVGTRPFFISCWGVYSTV